MAKAPSSLLAFFKNEYNKIDEVGEIDSKKVYSSEDYVELVKLDDQIAKNNIEKNQVGLNGMVVPEFGQDGMLLRTPRDRYQVNEEIAFAHRFRQNKGEAKEKPTITFVDDYRAIQEQSSGLIYTTGVVGYTIGRTEDGNYAVLEVETIPDNIFVNEFQHQLNKNDAKLMFEVVSHYKHTGADSGIDLDSLFA